MWIKEFEMVQRIHAKYGINPLLRSLEVGGGPNIVLDGSVKENPMLSLNSNIEFFDQGFIEKMGHRPHHVGDFTNPVDVKPLAYSFNIVYSFVTLEHVSDPRAFVANMVTVLRDSGLLFLTSVFSFPYHPSPEDYWRFTPSGLRLLTSGLPLNVIYSGWGTPAGSVILFGQKYPSDVPALSTWDFEEFMRA